MKKPSEVDAPGAATHSPRITVVGLGPAGAEFLSQEVRATFAAAEQRYLRTRRHPAADLLGDIESFDELYEQGETFDEVYRQIVDRLVAAAEAVAPTGGSVVYGVPGSPLIAERTVELLRDDPRVVVMVVPALSFLDLCWDRLGVDPLGAGVGIVDGTRFAAQATKLSGQVLVAQCWSRQILSDIKLTYEPVSEVEVPSVTILHHLGLADERIESVEWWDLDRTVAPDHLTSLWIPILPGGALIGPVSDRAEELGTEAMDPDDVAAQASLLRLKELVGTLRARCPWDMEQTHSSLAPHLLEESYEAIDAIADLAQAPPHTELAREAQAHLAEELGDVLFQVYFHTQLAEEEGAFTLAEVVDQLHAKLVHRHPHVFGDVQVAGAEEVLDNWEAIKKKEKGRTSVTEGIPSALPSLALVAKLQRKATSIGLTSPSFVVRRDELVASIALLDQPGARQSSVASESGDMPLEGAAGPASGEIGEMLFGLVDLSRRLGVDPEQALRERATTYRREIIDEEGRRSIDGNSTPESRDAS